MSIIITAPHSLCYDLSYRNCDSASLVASQRLAELLYKFGVQIKYFPANYHRSEIDLNRLEARNTDYRQSLTSTLEDSALLIDVHSFPYGAFNVNQAIRINVGVGYNDNSDNERDVKSGSSINVAVLDNLPGTWEGNLLYEIMVNHNIPVGYYYGGQENDIVTEARSVGLRSIIIEYGEFLSLDYIDSINLAVLEWVGTIMD